MKHLTQNLKGLVKTQNNKDCIKGHTFTISGVSNIKMFMKYNLFSFSGVMMEKHHA